MRRVLGSYDKIAHLIYAETGESVSGVSVRRWLKNRNLPINYACTLIDLVDKEEPGCVILSQFFPYLEDYFNGYLD